MRACLLLLALALVSLAQKMDPVTCDWGKEIMCHGEWDPKTGEQITADFCIPNKVGDCINHCPSMKCGENMQCPGKVDAMGCKMPDTCIPGST